jgi:hypothetical protein
MVIPAFLELPIGTTELSDTFDAFVIIVSFTGSQTMHPASKSRVLMLGLAFRLFEGDGGVIAVLPASWLLRMTDIEPSL